MRAGEIFTARDICHLQITSAARPLRGRMDALPPAQPTGIGALSASGIPWLCRRRMHPTPANPAPVGAALQRPFGGASSASSLREPQRWCSRGLARGGTGHECTERRPTSLGTRTGNPKTRGASTRRNVLVPVPAWHHMCCQSSLLLGRKDHGGAQPGLHCHAGHAPLCKNVPAPVPLNTRALPAPGGSSCRSPGSCCRGGSARERGARPWKWRGRRSWLQGCQA